MNKKILLTLFILLIAVFTVNVISASDVNVTDSYTTNLVDDISDVSVPLEDVADSSEISVSSDSNVDNDSSKVSLSSDEVLESENSNILSTSNDSLNSDVLSDANNSSAIDASKTITAKDITKYYKGSTQYSALFLDAQGNKLINTNVKITLNGVSYSIKTNANGVASMAINLKPGTYKVTAVNPVTGYSLTTTFKILSTISASNINKVYNDNRKFSAKFFKSDGSVLANNYVKFKINGKTYKVKTNKNGVASLSLKTLKKGKYNIISYNSDGLTNTNTVKVVKSTTTSLTSSYATFIKSDSSKKIKVQLLNKFGYAPSKGKLIKITVNGQTYYKKTNANGIAKLKLPTLKKGIYKVKYKFYGATGYKPSSTSSKVAILPSKNPTFSVRSGTTFTYGSKSTFKVAVSSGTVPLYKKAVTFSLNGKSYSKTTNSNGEASLSVNLVTGKYSISYSVAKDSLTNAKTMSSTITVKEKSTTKHNGYWVYGSDMNNVNLKTLSSNGVTDVFLNFKAYELYAKSGVESWISNANNVGINVHLWTQAFYSSSTGWVNPVINGKENTAFFTQKINEIKTYAGIKGLSGIHLDYLRYPGTAYKTSGGTEAISSFTNQVVSAVKSINSNLLVSAALMPETTDNPYYYGQDYNALSKSLDVVIPMIYKGNYGAGTSWITTTTKWFVDNSKGASVWSGIQTYKSDDDPTKLSTSDLIKDVNAAYSGGASGVILFRYGISNDVNFNSVTTSTNTISLSDIIAGANTIKSYYASNSKLPGSVTAGGKTYKIPDFLYMMGQAIYQIGNSNTGDVGIVSGMASPSSPSGDTIDAQLKQADFLTVAKNLVNFMNTEKRAPNYATSAVGKIIYSELVDGFSRILSFYGTNSRLPSYCTIKYGSSGSSSTGTGLNEVNKITNLNAYYKSSTNCAVGNSKIKSIVSSLTKGLTSDKDKATAIYNYVRDSISYTFYSNTKYGSVKTLTNKNGNCVDQAHLLVAMYRTAGLAARYVHGTCKFSSGNTYGHVWAQVLVDGKWICADPTSSRNSLGNINNWNTKSFTLHNIYVSLPF